jgi:CHAD domain-containing protein
LSQARDNEVVNNALEGLLERFGPAASGIQVAPLQHSLHNGQGRSAHALQAKQLSKIRTALRQSMTRAQAWKPALGEWECIATGLHKTYARARRALRNAKADRATDALHEWRKQTKYLWHQLQVLTPLATGAIGELADEFHHLADYLGDEHDLAVLRERLAAPSAGMNETAATALKALIERRREELQDKAFSLGERLCADKPEAFVHRLTKHWSEWNRRESRATSRQRAVAHPELRR